MSVVTSFLNSKEFSKLMLKGKELSLNTYKWKGDFDKFKQENLDEEDEKEDKGQYK